MIDRFRLKDVLVQYKQNFVSKQWGEEKYKWEAVKWFQDHWDVNAPDFAEMLNRSLDKTYNLLASANNFPKGMIVGFAKSAPEEVRAMFLSLYGDPITEFDDRLWLTVIDIVTVHRDGQLTFKFQTGHEISI